MKEMLVNVIGLVGLCVVCIGSAYIIRGYYMVREELDRYKPSIRTKEYKEKWYTIKDD